MQVVNKTIMVFLANNQPNGPSDLVIDSGMNALKHEEWCRQ